MSTAMLSCYDGYVPMPPSQDGVPVDGPADCPDPLIQRLDYPLPHRRDLDMAEEVGPDTRLMSGPINRLCHISCHLRLPHGLAETVVGANSHRIEPDKGREEAKRIRIGERSGTDAAGRENLDSIDRFGKASEKPYFQP